MTINRLNAVASPATFMRLNAKVLTHAEVQRGSLLTQLLIPGHFPSTSAPLHISHGSPAGLSFTLIPLTTELHKSCARNIQLKARKMQVRLLGKVHKMIIELQFCFYLLIIVKENKSPAIFNLSIAQTS